MCCNNFYYIFTRSVDRWFIKADVFLQDTLMKTKKFCQNILIAAEEKHMIHILVYY